jgi:4-amino-4-deoxychorismate lyase
MSFAASPECTWINGDEGASLSVMDRGFAFGDGVFETMRYRRDAIPLLEWHLRRLFDSCGRLRIAIEESLLRDEITQFHRAAAARLGDGIIKLIVTRGVSARGYRCETDAAPTRVLMQFPLPAETLSWNAEGVAIRYCDIRLGSNVALAGIKHLNRLEQVLARMEWSDSSIQEGLMTDARGRIVEGISSNLFLVIAGRMVTPVLDTCGVAGVMRQYILDEVCRGMSVPVAATACERGMLAGSQELFLCNAVAGVWPVRRLANKSWPIGPVTRKVQEHVARLFGA